MKLLTKAIAEKLIAGYRHSAETGESATEVVVKYFTPWANATWYITEGMPVTETGEPVAEEYHDWLLGHHERYDWHLYGWCDLGDAMNAELGYVMLSDLKGLKGPAGLRVERDLYSTTPSMAEVLERYGRAA